MEKLYPINGLFFYRLIFMLLLILGEALFCYKLEKKEKFTLKLILGVLACFVFALIFPIPTSNAFYSMMMFFLFFIFTFFISLTLFKADTKMIFFCLVCGYTIEHTAYELYSTLNCFLVATEVRSGGLYNYDELSLFANPIDFVLWIVSYINVYWIMFLLFARRIKKGQIFENLGSGKILIIGAVFIVLDIIFNSLISYYSSIHYEPTYIGLASLVNMIACVIGISFLFEMYYSSNLKREYLILSEIRNEEKNQYYLSKETIDMINIKCHDFRHQIRRFGKEQNVNEEAINNINKLINIYDSTVKTSNAALNVILSEKTLLCNKYNIIFSCIADGDAISFMLEEDIYSLFGNILDNAIEAVKKLPIEKRSIRLKIKSIGNIISVSAKNFYSGELKLVNGFPLTSKADNRNHGFGLKSIKLITEKYNGEMKISCQDQMFEIDLMFIHDSKDVKQSDGIDTKSPKN